MSLDVFGSSIAAADQDVARNAARDLPAGFSEAFDISTRSIAEWHGSANYNNARERALSSFYDDIRQKTGEKLPLYGLGGNVTLDDLNDAIAKLPQQPGDTEPSFTPLSEGSLNGMTLARMAKAHHDAEAFAARETTWGGTAGTVLGTLAAGLSDPVTVATLPLGGAGTVPIAVRALEFAAIAGGTEAANAGFGFSAREAAVPGSSKEIPGEIGTAALFGGALGGALGTLSKVLGHGAKPLPTVVRDEVNAAASELQFHATNPFPTAAGETAGRDGVIETINSILRNEPVRTGDSFPIGHTADFAAAASPEYRLATSAVPLNPDNSIVFVNADKVDAMLGPMNRTYTAEKRAGAKEFLASEPDTWNPPELSARVNSRNGKDIVDIVDGQHRWAAMRDNSMPVVPVEMNAASLKKARELGIVVDRPQPADYALAAKAATPEELALAGEKHLRPETFAERPDVEAFDRMPGAAEDTASYWENKLAAATPEERASLGATDSGPALVVARQMPDGTVKLGKPGEVHTDLMTARELRADGPTPPAIADSMGFATSDGKFLTRQEALEFAQKNEPHRAAYSAEGAHGLEAATYNEAVRPNAIAARDLTPEQVTKLAADPATESAVLHNLEHIIAEKPDMEFSTQVRLPDGSYQLTTQKLSDVLAELDGLEAAGRELEACAAGLAMAAE